jgi:hypothetical protein
MYPNDWYILGIILYYFSIRVGLIYFLLTREWFAVSLPRRLPVIHFRKFHRIQQTTLLIHCHKFLCKK